MLLSVIILAVVSDWTVNAETTQNTSPNNHAEKRIQYNQGALSSYSPLNNKTRPINRTYFEKDENPLRVPNKFYEGRKTNYKIKKKSKRTIQKIIKNGKIKTRKIYVQPVTRLASITSENAYIAESNTQRYVEVLTERNHKKRPRKSLKVVRYPMPFHSFQTKKEMNGRKRNRRDIDRDDIYILKDLDEVEFLSKEKDYDIVKAHVQNYW